MARRVFTAEFRREAVKLAQRAGIPTSIQARVFCVSSPTHPGISVARSAPASRRSAIDAARLDTIGATFTRDLLKCFDLNQATTK